MRALLYLWLGGEAHLPSGAAGREETEGDVTAGQVQHPLRSLREEPAGPGDHSEQDHSQTGSPLTCQLAGSDYRGDSACENNFSCCSLRPHCLQRGHPHLNHHGQRRWKYLGLLKIFLYQSKIFCSFEQRAQPPPGSGLVPGTDSKPEVSSSSPASHHHLHHHHYHGGNKQNTVLPFLRQSG